jgi:hypothetical protein
MQKRTNLIVNRILRRIKQDTEANVEADAAVILDELNEVQKEVARRALAMKSEIRLTLEKGTERYDTESAIYKIAYMAVYSKDGSRLSEPEFCQSPEEYADAKEDASVQACGNPVKVLIWDRYLRLTPTPATTGDVLLIHGHILPANALSMDKDPELGSQWDRVLEFGVLANILGGDWVTMFEAKLAEVSQLSMMETATVNKISHWSDKTGF